MNVAKTETDKYYIYGYTQADTKNNYAKGPIIIKNPIYSLSTLGFSVLTLDCYVSK